MSSFKDAETSFLEIQLQIHDNHKFISWKDWLLNCIIELILASRMVVAYVVLGCFINPGRSLLLFNHHPVHDEQ